MKTSGFQAFFGSIRQCQYSPFLLSEAGVSPSDTVILYGDNNNWFASYAFWLFKIYGHRDVRLMNGGRVKWLNEADKELVADQTKITPTQYRASEPDLSLRALRPARSAGPGAR